MASRPAPLPDRGRDRDTAARDVAGRRRTCHSQSSSSSSRRTGCATSARTVATYDENFWNNGHSPRIIVFDDSSVANHEKYYSLLEKTRTWSDVFYVGPNEKEPFGHLLPTT